MHALRDSRICGQGTSSSSSTLGSMRATPRLSAPATSTAQRLRNLQVICMAHPRRVAKVASQIQREVSEMFIYDKVVQEAICPEKKRGLDDQLSAVASITEVYVSGDLQVAKVYVSVYSDEAGKERAIANLKRVAPYVRSRIGAAMGLRLTPEIRFIQDNSLDELEQLQDAIGREEFARFAAEAEAESGSAPAVSTSSSTSSGGRQAGAGRSNAEAAAGFGQEDLDDDSGFFEMPEDADADSAAAAAAGADGQPGSITDSSAVRPKVEWSRHDPNSFFAVDEDEVEEADSAWYSRRGPFDDLFGDAGEELVQERQQQHQQQQQQRKGGSVKRRSKGSKAAKQQ